MARHYEAIAGGHAATTSSRSIPRFMPHRRLLNCCACSRLAGPTVRGTGPPGCFGDADLVKFAGVSPDARTARAYAASARRGHRCVGGTSRGARLMRFATPWFLLLLLVPLLRLWLRRRNERRRDGAVAWVSAGVLEGMPRTPRARLAPLPRWLEFAGALAAGTGAGAAAARCRQGTDPAPVPEHHRGARHFEQHEGD